MKKAQIILGLVLVFAAAEGVQAKPLAFPEEELAKESVLPVFDVPNSVRNRNVPVANKVEFGVFAGAVTDEPLFKQLQYGVVGTYHFNEFHGLNFTFAQMEKGIGTYAEQLKNDPTVGLDITNAFGPQSYALANYQYTAFYGKLSILKKLVINTHIYGLGGLGAVLYDGQSALALSAGLGQRFYLWPNLALRFDLKWVRFSGPDALSRSKTEIQSGALKIDDYDTTTYLLSNITAGLVFLF